MREIRPGALGKRSLMEKVCGYTLFLSTGSRKSDLLWAMTLGRSPTEEDLFRTSTEFCRERVQAGSIYGLLHREGYRLFPDEAFADLFKDIGRASVPPR
ncbi:MAG TPA: hypothetical protein VF550_15960, partial [Polyangia bacterium]